MGSWKPPTSKRKGILRAAKTSEPNERSAEVAQKEINHGEQNEIAFETPPNTPEK